MSETNWDELYRESNPSKAYDIFLQKVSPNYDCAFPHVTVKKHGKARKESVTPPLFKRIEEKSCMFFGFLQTRNQADLVEFKRYRNKLSLDLKKAKNSYYENKISPRN